MPCLILAVVVLLALPASATAGVTLTEFKVEPAAPQAGGHPSVKITQAFSYPHTTDDVQAPRPARAFQPCVAPPAPQARLS